MATIIVAPATTFAPASPVEGDIVFGDTKGTLSGRALAQTSDFVSTRSTTFGDAWEIKGSGCGGADRFHVRAVDNDPVYDRLYGDADTLSDSAQGGNDRITTRGSTGPIWICGDAHQMTGETRGGNDYIDGETLTEIIGDAFELNDQAVGVDDKVYVRHSGLGDAYGLNDQSRGGDDVIYGRRADISLAGDADSMKGDSRGGNDRICDNAGKSFLYGDAGSLSVRAMGGDDFLHSKSGGSELYGDALGMYDTAKGGNDVLSGSSGRDMLVGEAWYLLDKTMAGDDVLLGGKGNDLLYGDAISVDTTVVLGADRFVFGGASGKDVIGDFERGKDVIDVRALGYTGLGQFALDEVGSDSIVHFRGANQVTVLGVTGLAATDFLFA